MRQKLLPLLSLAVLIVACARSVPVARDVPSQPDEKPILRDSSSKPDEEPVVRDTPNKPDDEPVTQEPPDEPDDEPVEQEKLGKLTLTLDPGGHTRRICKVFFTPDGSQLITLGLDHTIHFWDVETGRRVRVLYPPGVEGLQAAALSADGKRLAFASYYLEEDKRSQVVYVLALPEGKSVRVLRYLTDQRVECLAFSPDGKYLAAGCGWGDPRLRIWNLEEEVERQQFFSNRPAFFLAFCPVDANRLAWGGDMMAGKERGQILDLTAGKRPVRTAGGHVAWSPDGKLLATAVSQVGVRLWDADGNPRGGPYLPGKSFRQLAFSKDSQKVLIGWQGGNFRAALLEVATGKEKEFPPNGIPWWACFAGDLSPDGRLAATGGGGGGQGKGAGAPEAFLWKLADGTVHRRLASPGWLSRTNDALEAAWGKDGKTVSWDKRPNARSFHLGKLRFGPPVPNAEAQRAIRQRGDLSLKREPDKPVKAVREGQPPVPLKLGAVVNDATLLVGEDRKNQAVVAGNSDFMCLFDTTTGKELRRFRGSGRFIAPSPDGRFLLAVAPGNQTLRVYSLDREEPLLWLYMRGEDWIVWTREGYYAATPGGERLLGWKADHGIDQMPTVYPAEQFRQQLYRPDVIQLVLEKGSVEAAVKAANAARKAKQVEVPKGPGRADKLLPPTVTLAVKDQQKPRVVVQVTAKQGCPEQPIKSLCLLVGNRQLPDRQALVTFDAGKEKAEHQQTWTVKLPPGKHTLTVLARSRDDTPGISNYVEVDCPLPPGQRPVLHHVAVGINQYAHPKVLKLDFARPDAEALAKAFADSCQASALYGRAAGKSLVDNNATRAAVLEAIKAVRQAARPGDLFVFSFAGHGVREEAEFFLLTHEADPTSAKTLATTAVAGGDLRQELVNFPCQVLLLLDACHAGAFAAGLRPGTNEAARELADVDARLTVLCAAQGHQEALGTNGHGLFTAAVLRALQRDSKAPYHPKTGQLNVIDLWQFVYREVMDSSQEKQTPYLKMPLTQPAFVVAQFEVSR